MLESHQRAALFPNDPGVQWHHFLGGRFIGPSPRTAKNTSLALVAQTIDQQSPIHATLRGLIELSSGGSLPIVTEFVGELNLETREISIHQPRPDMHYTGRFSENGRVLVLRANEESKSAHLVHEETLAKFV